MTTVRLYRGAEGRIIGYEISGHTGFAASGQDIVCAALSFLSITCANALEMVAGREPKVKEKDGYLSVMAQGQSDKEQTILKVFELGITQLHASYPDHIRLTEQEP